MLSVNQDRTKYHFSVFGMTRPGIEYWSPGPLANTLLNRTIKVKVNSIKKIFSSEICWPISQNIINYIYIYIRKSKISQLIVFRLILSGELVIYASVITFSSHTHIYIGIMVRVFVNSPRHLSSLPGRVILKTQKMVVDASLLNIPHYKLQIKGNVGQSWERSGTLSHTLV